MTFSSTFLGWLVYGSLAAVTAGGALLVALLARDAKNRKIW